MKNISTKSITKIGILSAIVIILSLSPIGFIPLGPVRITTVHIPIILIALIEKPTVSFFQHLSGISTLSFMFINPMVSILPRALIGIGTYYTFIFVKKYIKNIFNVVFASMVGTMINTFGVLSMAYIFCSNQIYEVLKINPAKFLFGVAISNGIPEIIVCSILVPMIYKSLQKILKF